jgi:hypothetical protein
MMALGAMLKFFLGNGAKKLTTHFTIKGAVP